VVSGTALVDRSRLGLGGRSDADAYFSRPGPRLVDGVELLAELLHPTTGSPPLGATRVR
jgi:hypothetical protein